MTAIAIQVSLQFLLLWNLVLYLIRLSHRTNMFLSWSSVANISRELSFWFLRNTVTFPSCFGVGSCYGPFLTHPLMNMPLDMSAHEFSSGLCCFRLRLPLNHFISTLSWATKYLRIWRPLLTWFTLIPTGYSMQQANCWSFRLSNFEHSWVILQHWNEWISGVWRVTQINLVAHYFICEIKMCLRIFYQF